MSELFATERSVITKHLRNIFQTGELVQHSVCAFFAHTAEDGKRVADHTLVALTDMIAESSPTERELMVNLVMTFLADDDPVNPTVIGFAVKEARVPYGMKRQRP